jgi:hypothetical protein
MPQAKVQYEDLIFMNCTFDTSYYPLLRDIIFAVYRCCFTPTSELGTDNSLQNRLAKIQNCILSAKYGIHDISRTGLNAKQLPRFNMPFELGLFFGAKEFGSGKQKDKNAIIFDRSKYRYQSFISDLNGIDIKAHVNDPCTVIKYIRDWLHVSSKRKNLPGETVLIQEYKKFKKTVPYTAKRLGFKPSDIPYDDYCGMTEAGIRILLSAG